MKVRIKDYDYTILEVDESEFALLPGQTVFGQTDVVDRTIKLMRETDLERKIKSLIHELSHAFQDAYGFINIDITKETIANFDEVCLLERYKIADKYFWNKHHIDIIRYMEV